MQASLDREVEHEKKMLLEAAEDRQETQLGEMALEQDDDQTSSRRSLLVSLLLLCVYEISEGAGDICWRIRLDSARRLLRYVAFPVSKCMRLTFAGQLERSRST